MNKNIVTLENVSKSYENNIVLDCISHDFVKGESVAFAGHNGCGKSTLLKVIGGIVSINQGHVKYFGKIRFSYVPEKFIGFDVTMEYYLKRIAEMEGVKYSKVQQLIKDFYLDDMTYIKMNNMSKGSLQKVGVIQALMAPHDIILLDEPLSGQDADSQEVFITKINELKEQGITIFMSCHEKKLMDELSDKIFTIEEGKLKNLEKISEASFRIFVRRNHNECGPKMILRGNKTMHKVKETQMKETVMKLYDDGWEVIGIEEYI